jgi:hypothetical protein
MSIKINFNGRDYNGTDEMPALVRAQYMKAVKVVGDKNKNGIPDVIEQGNLTGNSKIQTKIIFNGKEYKSVNEMPSGDRAIYEKMMQKMAKGGPTNKLEVQTSFNVTHDISSSDAPISFESSGSMPVMWKVVMILIGLAIAVGALWFSKNWLPGLLK